MLVSHHIDKCTAWETEHRTHESKYTSLIITMGKKVIYLTIGNGNQFSMRHLERILEIERESEEQFAINNDVLEMYEKKWEKYLTV